MTWEQLSTIGFAVLAAGGWALAFWATLTLWRFGVVDLRPQPVRHRCTAGPYRFLRHPMYVGHVATVVGLFGLACGGWGALAGYKVAELLVSEWASREVDISGNLQKGVHS